MIPQGRRKRPSKEEQAERLRRMTTRYELGVPINDIANAENMSYERVRQILRPKENQ